MLPADTIAEITTAIAALNLQPDTAAQILAAVFAPLLRSAETPPVLEPPSRPSRRSSKRARGSSRRRYQRRAPTEARDKALAVLHANPDATTTEIAKIAKVSRSTVVKTRNEIEKAERKAARKAAREPPTPIGRSKSPKPAARRARAQSFLREQLAHGAKPVSDVEAAAEKARIDPTALEQARGDLHVVASRANAGGVQAVQWSLPG